MTENTDNVLVTKAQAGDLAAEEELLRRYKELARVKANMYYMVGADEDDVLQEGMIGLLKAVRQYDPEKEAGFRTFAGICITNQIISAIRSSRRNKHKALNTSVSLDTSIGQEEGGAGEAQLRLEDTLMASPADSPEQMLLMRDIIECILHNDDRVFSEYELQVVTERMRGKPADIIAAELGRTKKSVDNCMHRARKKILAYLIA
ncbi:MAG: sigma-70 family RNA polymerase sigma factor [Firmicutes bacterium]|nr:sigma-70 family RNA polymerase sigma factor [Bacillota bacterium]